VGGGKQNKASPAAAMLAYCIAWVVNARRQQQPATCNDSQKRQTDKHKHKKGGKRETSKQTSIELERMTWDEIFILFLFFWEENGVNSEEPNPYLVNAAPFHHASWKGRDNIVAYLHK
jgi:hypothetical protein